MWNSCPKFYSHFSTISCIVSDVTMVDELCNGKDVEGCGPGLIELLSCDSLKQIRKLKEKLSQDCQYPGRDSNRALPV
jgi:hypothetical protein